jgi:DNA mismatch repair ATPase MutS
MKCGLHGKDVTYDHKLHLGSSRESFGVEMATSMLPTDTIDTANALRNALETHGYQDLSAEGRAQVQALIACSEPTV